MKIFDLRLPLGWLFTLVGVLLVVASVLPASENVTAGNVSGREVNLVWGAVLIWFGLVCLWFARRERKRSQSAGE